jgi:hypothetical protein
MATHARQGPCGDLASRLFATRKLTLDLAAPLSDADTTVQPFPDASPAKWHLAHTSWFFETFVLRDHAPGYRPFDDLYAFLFNSYYEAEGPRHARPRRGMLSRPSLDEIRSYRAHVDEALERTLPSLSPAALELVELGINHEQQHQELFLTDILATFAEIGEDPPDRPVKRRGQPVDGDGEAPHSVRARVEHVKGEKPAQHHLDDDHPGEDGKQKVCDVDEGNEHAGRLAAPPCRRNERAATVHGANRSGSATARISAKSASASVHSATG